MCANNCIFSLKLQKIITARIKEMIKTAGYESRYLEIPSELNNYRRYIKTSFGFIHYTNTSFSVYVWIQRRVVRVVTLRMQFFLSWLTLNPATYILLSWCPTNRSLLLLPKKLNIQNHQQFFVSSESWRKNAKVPMNWKYNGIVLFPNKNIPTKVFW